MSQAFSKGGEWTLLDENGAEAVNFTSFISMSVNDGGSVLSYPVEEGGFIHYNKTQSPLEISLTLAAQGDDADFEYMLQRLKTYNKDAVMLTVVTPSAVYPNMTLKSFSNKRAQDGGAGMLVVDLSLTEVREVGKPAGIGTVISQPFNPTSFAKVTLGRALPAAITNSLSNAIRSVK